MGAVVVHDRVDELARGDRRLNGVEEAEELLVAVPLHGIAPGRAALRGWRDLGGSPLRLV